MSTTLAQLEKQIQAFQRERNSLAARVAEASGLLPRDQLMLQYLDLIARELAAASPAAASAAAADGSQVEVSLTVATSLKDINEFILAAQDAQLTPGYVAGYVFQQSVLVPAASGATPGSAEIVFETVPGSVATVFGQPVLASDDVAAGVDVTITADGRAGVGPQGYVLGPAESLPIAQYLISKDTGIVVSLRNPSASDVTVYFYAVAIYVTIEFFEQFYTPAIGFAMRHFARALGFRNGGAGQ